MCKFCEETDNVISEERMIDGDKLFADLRFDSDNNSLEVNFGFVNGFDYWTNELKINFCPICGEKLKACEE